MAEMTTRVKVIEEILTQWPELVERVADTAADRAADTRADRRADRALTPADKDADTPPTGADTATRRPRKLTPRQQRALRDKRQRGVAIEALMEEYGISKPTVFRYLRSPKRGS
jgi:predicted DNA binding protein